MTSPERRVAWLAGCSHLFTHGAMTLLPGVLVVLAAEQSLGFFSLGAVVNLGYFLFGLGSIPAGVLVDRFGARKVLELGNLGMALGLLLTGLAPNSVTFALAYGLLGMAASLYHPAGLALIARNIPKKGRALSMHGVLGNVGLSGAPLFAGAMLYLFDTWRAAYLGFGALGLLFVFVARRFEVAGEERLSLRDLPALFKPAAWSAPPAEAAAEPAAIPLSLLVSYLGAIVFGFVYRGSLTFFPKLFQQEVAFVSGAAQPVVMAGAVTSAILAFGMLGQWAGGSLTDRLKRQETGHLVIYLVVIPSSWLMGRLTDTPLLVASTAFSLVFYGWQPLQNALVAKLTRATSHGRGYGVNFFLIMGMGSAATAAGGYITDTYGVDAVFSALSAIAWAGLAVAVGLRFCSGYVVRFRLALERKPEVGGEAGVTK